MSNPTSPTTPDKTLRLPDGRGLCYAEYGALTGVPVLFCHGAPGSRRSVFADMAEAAAQRGIRLIVPDRPGHGRSDPLAGRSVGDWTNDVLALTSALGIDRFRLIGFSMGSLYALACAQALPSQVERVAVVSTLAPMGVAGVNTGRSAGVLALYEQARSDPHGLRDTMMPLAKSSASLFETMAAAAPAVDQALLAERRPWFEADFAESLRNGIEGIASDFVLAAGEWTFQLWEIQATVDLWLGTEDCNTPPPMARHLEAVLPHSRLFEYSGEGHFCLYTRWHEILERLLAQD